MHVEKIGPEHARALGRLEAEIYPSGFCLGWQDFQEDLQEAEADNGNFSFGLFEESEMVGYLVAYASGQSIYISDFAVLPTNRADRSLAALMGAFLMAARDSGLAFCAECRESTWRFASRHPRFFQKFGFKLAKHHIIPHYNGGEDHWHVRFEPISTPDVMAA